MDNILLCKKYTEYLKESCSHGLDLLYTMGSVEESPDFIGIVKVLEEEFDNAYSILKTHESFNSKVFYIAQDIVMSPKGVPTIEEGVVTLQQVDLVNGIFKSKLKDLSNDIKYVKHYIYDNRSEKSFNLEDMDIEIICDITDFCNTSSKVLFISYNGNDYRIAY